jgi:hypothetical protein
MISFIYFMPYWVFFVIFIRTQLTCFTWSYTYSCYSNDCLRHLNMPVTTRSKAKSKHSSVNEAPDQLINPNISTNEQLSSMHEQHTSKLSASGPINGPLLHPLSDSSVNSSLVILLHLHYNRLTIPLDLQPSLENVEDFNSFLLPFKNFEISKFGKFFIPSRIATFLS